MKTIARALLLLASLYSNAHAVVMGNLAGINQYNAVGSVISGAGSLGSFVAISEQWVLTAAHVVDGAAGVALVGGHPDAPGGEAFFFFIDDIIVHPNYIDGEFHDDLALIKISIGDPINPAAHSMSFATFSSLPQSGAIPPSAVVTGYGQTEIGVNTTGFDRRFISAPTTQTDPFVQAGAPPIATVFPTDCGGDAIVCTYGTVGGAPGDSGGGIFMNTVEGQLVAAINSFIFDESDLDPTEPLDWTDGYWTVGTSVAAYEDWIKNPQTGVFTGANFSAAAFVPLPAAVWLFGSSAMGLLALRRRANRTPWACV